MKYLLLLISLFSLVDNCSFGQATVDDKVSEADTAGIYKVIEKYSRKKGFTRFLYKTVFVTPPDRPQRERTKDKNFYKYKGRIIRNIQIVTYDPFGYNVNDTSATPWSFIQKGGNVLHQKSTYYAIANQLLVRSGDSLDILKLKESERVIRQSEFVRDVTFYVKPVRGTKDSVDIFIREQDLWTKTFGIGFSSSNSHFSFGDKNFLGLSHQLNTNIVYTNSLHEYDLIGDYTVPYIKNTFITATAYFNTSRENYVQGLSINRPFYSPLTKWAGGIDMLSNKRSEILRTTEFGNLDYSIRYNDFDTWIGRSFPLYKDTSEKKRGIRFIASMRYQNITYLNPTLPLIIDSNNFHTNRNFYLASFGISSRKYYRDFYIFRYGTPEDVPVGKVAQGLIGYETKMNTGRIYAGIQLGSGNYFDRVGYFSAIFGYGTFFRQGTPEQGVANVRLGYISNLIVLGDWRMRQFVKAETVYGLSRNPLEVININNENGLSGFESPVLNGTNKFLLRFQTQAYSPFSFIGFRFAPFFFVNFGFVGNNQYSFLKSRAYQAFGIGILIKNELLVINSFQFTFAFYPEIPGAGDNVVRFNPARSYDFEFSDFGFSKPYPVAFE